MLKVILAKEAGLSYAAVAMATDYDCWHESEKAVCVPEVLKAFKANVEKITKLFIHAVQKIAEKNWDDIIQKNRVSLNTVVLQELVDRTGCLI